MGKEKIYLGRIGEKLAWQYLKKSGFKLVVANYRCPYGEIDLIVQEKDTLIFVEVRSRRGQHQTEALASIDQRKQNKIRQTALYYLQEQEISENSPLRFDVIAVTFNASQPLITHLCNAF